MKDLFKLLKPYKKKLTIVGILYAISTVCLLIMPDIMSNIINNGVGKGDMNYIYRNGALMILVALLSLITSLMTIKYNISCSTGLVKNLRSSFFCKVNTLTFEEFSKVGTSSLLTRAADDTWAFYDIMGSLVYVIVVTPLLFIGGFIMAFRADPTIAFVILGIVPIVIFITWLCTRNVHNYWEISEYYSDQQNKIMRERLTGLRVIRSFNNEPQEHERIKKATITMQKYIVRANNLTGLVNPVSVLVLNIATVVILYIGAQRIQVSSALTAGQVIANIQYIALILNGVLTFSTIFIFFPLVKVNLRRINEVIAIQTSNDHISSGEKLSGEIAFDNVSFAYPNSEIDSVKNLNIQIKDGEIIGIIGGTGSGKSTLAKLLVGFYKPTSGTLRIGNKDVMEMTGATIRDNVSISLQKAMIFQGTIADNIRMGKKDATDDEIKEIADIAQLKELISGTDGLNRELTQAGANISGGQKQRINIARTTIKPASIYIFDDSFSALDYLTETKLRKKLNKYLSGKTQIVITQRAATAMRCDKVYVLDKGQIVGAGQHKDLIVNCPIYKEIYDSQLGGRLHD